MHSQTCPRIMHNTSEEVSFDQLILEEKSKKTMNVRSLKKRNKKEDEGEFFYLKKI